MNHKMRYSRLGMLIVAAILALLPCTASAIEPDASPAAAAAVSTSDDSPGDLLGRPPRTLRHGTALQAGLSSRGAAEVASATATGLDVQPNGRPLYAGAVVLAGRRGVVPVHEPMGYALRYVDSAPTELPRDRWVPMARDTIFDLASISKLFTSIAVMQRVQMGQVDLEAPVARYLPPFAANGKETITIRQMLTHTSGMPGGMNLTSYSDYDSRISALYAIKPLDPPGTVYRYSDINMATLGKLVEEVSGESLNAVVRKGITKPLGMTDTGYNPPPSTWDRVAATEYQPSSGRGTIRGTVHDEDAYYLGGVAGHAGVFSTASDLAVLAQTILNGGSYGHARILSRESTALMLTNFNRAFPNDSHGLGFDLAQPWYMGEMSTPYTAGHYGYTGTSLVIDPTTESFVILLTNRVHPSRDWGSINPVRQSVANAMARAMLIQPIRGETSRYSWLRGGENHDVDHTAGAARARETTVRTYARA